MIYYLVIKRTDHLTYIFIVKNHALPMQKGLEVTVGGIWGNYFGDVVVYSDTHKAQYIVVAETSHFHAVLEKCLQLAKRDGVIYKQTRDVNRISQGSQPLWKSGKTLKMSFQFSSQGKRREFGKNTKKNQGICDSDPEGKGFLQFCVCGSCAMCPSCVH